MVKLAAVGLLLLLLCSCGTLPALTSKGDLPDLLSDQKRLLWSKELSGYVSDLNLARDGSAILVSTAPNYDSEKGAREYNISLFDHRGELLWKRKPEAPVKAQAIADDGSWVVIATYNDRLSAFSRAGELLWSAEGTCRPVILSRSKQVLCHHDDDADAEVAFEVFDFQGKKQWLFPISGPRSKDRVGWGFNDVLSLKVSDDGRFLAMALTRGQLLLLDQDFRTIWQRSVSGEIVDLDLTVAGPKAEPRIAVLFFGMSPASSENPTLKEFKVSLYGLEGEATASASAPFGGRQIFLGPDGDSVWVENISQGKKCLVFFTAQSELTEKWRREEPFSADLLVSSWINGTSILTQKDESSFVSFDVKGESEWKLPVSSIMKGQLYLSDYAPGSGSFVVATEEGNLALVNISPDAGRFQKRRGRPLRKDAAASEKNHQFID